MTQKIKVTYLMLAYNGERFIKNSIESVLNQKEKDIRLVIRDNGSVDSTGDICKYYAKKDKRVVYLDNKVGFITDDGIKYEEREFWPPLNSEYVAFIDHDDLLDSEFTTCLYKVAKQNNSDISICSCAFFDDETGKITGYRSGADFSISNICDLNKFFSDVYGSFRPLWGKLYRSEFFDKYYDEVFQGAKENCFLSGDTFAVFTFLEHCKSISSVNKPLYYYRVSNNSHFFSKVVDLRRINDADVLFNKAMNFLVTNDIFTDENKICLLNVHWGHMCDLLNILAKSTAMSVEEKIIYIQEILKNDYLKFYIDYSFDIMWSSISIALDQLLEKNEDYLSLHKYYIVRLYNAIRNKKIKTQSSYINILSVILDNDNINSFGFSLLSDRDYCISEGERKFCILDEVMKKNLLEGDIIHLLEFFMYPYSKENIRNDEVELENLLIQENYEKASELLFELGQKYPECESVVNYRIQLFCMIGEIDSAKELCNIAKVLYKENEEISELCDEVLL